MVKLSQKIKKKFSGKCYLKKHNLKNRKAEYTVMIMHIVGNRPQFIKLAPVVKAFDKRDEKQIIIHTGQHYDANMSDVFFEELGIPQPAKNLQVGSGSHAEVTGRAMIELEKVILEYNPKLVVVYGDTNSTLAGAIACRKLNYPLCHIEAGTRTFNRQNPEENNRIMTDHISDYLFCADRSSVINLKNEGIEKNVFFSGDVMLDIFNDTPNSENALKILEQYNLREKGYYLMTWHRQENTDSVERIQKIIDLIKKINYPIVCPLHPRTKHILERNKMWDELKDVDNFICIEPVGYNEMVTLNRVSKGIICDSGGLSKEAFYAGKKCLFTLKLDVWPDLLKSGWIQQYTDDTAENERAIQWFVATNMPENRDNFYGDGTAAEMVAATMVELINGEKR